MSPDPDTEKQGPATPSRSRRIFRAVAWLGTLWICYAGLFALIGAVIASNAPGVINAVAASHGVHIGDVILRQGRSVEVRDFVMQADGREITVGRFVANLHWKGAKFPHLSSVRIERPRIVLTDLGDLAQAADMESQAPSPFPQSSLALDRLEIIDGELVIALPGQPSVSSGFNVEASELKIAGDQISTGPIDLDLARVTVGHPGRESEPSLFSADEIIARLQLTDSGLSGKVDSLRLVNPNIHLRPEDLDLLQQDDSKPAEAPPAFDWHLAALDIEGARIFLEDFDRRKELLIPDIHFLADLHIADLVVSDKGVSSPATQTARISDITIDGGTSETTDGVFTKIGEAYVELIPDNLLKDGWIEKLRLEHPDIEISYDRMARFESLWNPGDVSVEDVPSTEPAPEMPVFKFREFTLEGGMARFDLSGFDSSLPKGTAAYVTGTSEGEEPGSFRINFSKIEIEDTSGTNAKYADAAEIVMRLSGEGLQRKNTIDGIEINSAEVKIGEEINRIAAAFSAPPVTGEEDDQGGGVVDDEAPPTVPWTIGELAVKNSRLILEDLAPGLSFVPLDISTTITNLPIDGSAPQGDLPQRIELGRIAIRSVRNSLVNIAALDSIFVEFTLAGLFKSEIEKIEIVSPKVFVGEHLFWYIDAIRQDMAKAAKEAGIALPNEPATGEPVIEIATDVPAETDPSRVSIIEDALRGEVVSGWKIKAIELFAGQLFLAPKGVTLTNLPLPFSTATEFDTGEIDINLKIASGDYPFPGLELTVGGLEGEAQFNYPFKRVDNNLVQTFEAEWIEYKRDLRIDGISLTVTYDAKGIYGKIWAKGYGGDVNGEFNIYIGEKYKWDGWLSAVRVDVGAVADALIPDMIEAEGKLTATLIANGEDLELEEAKGKLELSGGKVHFLALQEVSDALPDSWSEWQKSLARAGIDVFRLYRFDNANGNLDFIGWNGKMRLEFGGPDGKRDLELKFESDGNPAILLKEFVERTVVR